MGLVPIELVQIELKYKNLAVVAVLASLAVGLFAPAIYADTGDVADDLSGPSGVIISKYLQASQVQPVTQGASMQVDIDASVPNLQQHGTLKALRQISKVGRVTYHVLGFQGDNTIKNQVIARYMEAEQQQRNRQNLNVTPANYKFKFKGERRAQDGTDVYVFQLSPRTKRVGLFKGEMWLNASNYLPVVEKGRFVKNPSIFFKKVDFEQAFGVHNGASVPEHMSSTIDTRLVGKVHLNVSYSNFAEDVADEDASSEAKTAVFASSLP